MSHWAPGCPLALISGNLRAMAAAIAADALDDAIEMGLLAHVSISERSDIDASVVCEECAAHDRRVTSARDARLRALAARERFRARQARLAERAEAKARRRAATTSSQAVEPGLTTQPSPAAPALPSAALEALARAKARAAAKRSG